MCNSMPVGMPKLVNLTVKEFLDTDFYGFVEATVTAPVNEYIGLLPIKIKGRLVCPGGRFNGLFFSEELRFALANGYEILEIRRAFSFKRGVNTFLQLITQLNDMKITAQQNKQATIRNLAKLLMNSMYGRFGMHPTFTSHHIWTQQQIKGITKAWMIENRIPLGEFELVTTILNKEWILETQGEKGLRKQLENQGNKTNVAIAAAVTAHSRIIINTFKLEALNQGLELFYSDTDSLVLNGPLPEKFIDSAALGKLKLEHVIKEGIFVMPKVYYLEDEDGNVVSKAKGYSGKLNKAQYLDLLEGNTLHLEVTKWSRSLKNTYVQILRNQPYDLTFSFNKRKRIFENNRWVVHL